MEQVKTIVMEAVDSAVAVSQKSGASEYELKCKDEFENDFLEQEKYQKFHNIENHSFN